VPEHIFAVVRCVWAKLNAHLTALRPFLVHPAGLTAVWPNENLNGVALSEWATVYASGK